MKSINEVFHEQLLIALAIEKLASLVYTENESHRECKIMTKGKYSLQISEWSKNLIHVDTLFYNLMPLPP